MSQKRHNPDPELGAQFGFLTVPENCQIKRSRGKVERAYEVRCVCGQLKTVRLYHLLSGCVTSCGCRGAHKIQAGDTFGRLTVLAVRHIRKPSGRTTYVCDTQCECGRTSVVSAHNLIAGNQVSCGCYRLERLRQTCSTHRDASKTHGRTRLYSIWCGIKKRCTNPRSASYPHYDGRGIAIHPDWLNYSVFKEWALAHGYSDDLTIDRIDVNGDYCPKNCRWAIRLQQANNKRSNHFILAFGITKTLSEWSRDPRCVCASYNMLKDRITKLGWDAERAICTAPIRHHPITRSTK